MHTPYRSRSHTKKENNCKRRLSFAEKKKRVAIKKLSKLFPSWKFHFQHGKQKNIYQHSTAITLDKKFEVRKPCSLLTIHHSPS